MTATVTIRVAEFAGGPFAVSAEDGQRLYERISPLLPAGRLESPRRSFADWEN